MEQFDSLFQKFLEKDVMINVMVWIGGIGLAFQAFIGLSFFMSCIWEKEGRATTFALAQLISMTAVLAAFLMLATGKFSHTAFGTIVLII